MRSGDAGGPPSSRRPSALLIAGAVVGMTVALLGLVRRPAGSGALHADVAARVGEAEIDAEDFARAVDALTRDRRTAPDAAEQRRVLERLIDEELLVQRALDLGFARVDRTVRASLVDAMIASVTTAARDAEPSPAELERFYLDEPDLFRQPGRLRVREVFVPVGADEAAARRRVQAVRARVEAGESFAVVAASVGPRIGAGVPDIMLPPAKLREYVGPTALRAVLALEVGAVSAPIRSGGGYRVLELVERGDAFLPEFAGMEATIRAEYRRRAGERALAEYLRDLRARATIVRSDPLP